ncbi:MAG: MBL fold metallo-hydrolase [Chloroflexota bacterium]
MKVQTLVIGPLQTNVYVIADEETRQCAVIDPPTSGEALADGILAEGLDLRYVLATHGHADHTGGIADLVEMAGGEFVGGAGDRDQFEKPWEDLAAMIEGFVNPPALDVPVSGGEILELGQTRLIVIATPGHTPGSVCYLAGTSVFTGDTLFKGSIGRYDLPGADGAQELQSIRDNLLTLPDQVSVYPGHGPSTTIGAEREQNPFLREMLEGQ